MSKEKTLICSLAFNGLKDLRVFTDKTHRNVFSVTQQCSFCENIFLCWSLLVFHLNSSFIPQSKDMDVSLIWDSNFGHGGQVGF